MNPVDMQIIGIEGRAQVLRESAKSLDLNVDKVVPSESVMRAKSQAAQQQAAAQQQMQPQGGQPQEGQPQGGQPQNGQELLSGAPVTDNFSPTPQ
jgi:hypothetical protein